MGAMASHTTENLLTRAVFYFSSLGQKDVTEHVYS